MIIEYFLLIWVFLYKILHNIFLYPQELGMAEHSSIPETEEANITSVRDKLILIIIAKVRRNVLSFKANWSGNLVKYNQIFGGNSRVLENYINMKSLGVLIGSEEISVRQSLYVVFFMIV